MKLSFPGPTMPSPFATQEDPTNLWYERSTFIASHLAAIGYGIHVAVFCIVTYYILQQRKAQSGNDDRSSSSGLWWFIINGTLFALGTINLACGVEYNGRAWVTERQYPDGPFGFLFEQQSLPVMTLGNVTSVLASFIADGILLYRVWVLWSDSKRWVQYAAILGPAGFYIACVVTSILAVVQIALPDSGMPPLTLAVWIILMILPMVLTAMIVWRIWYHRQRLVKLLGPDHASPYTGVAALVVESALPFTVLSIILLGLFGSEDVAQNLFVPLLVQVECIAPELIILRVIRGRALSKETTSSDGALSELKFTPPDRRSMVLGEIAEAGRQATPTAFSILTTDIEEVGRGDNDREKKSSEVV